MAAMDELIADCRLRAATDLFTHIWDPVVLAGLHAGPLRRSELLTAVGGISDKALTEALRRLLANGLVERRRLAGQPPRAEYRLTELGTSLVDGPLRAMGRWITDHGDALLAAQDQTSNQPR